MPAFPQVTAHALADYLLARLGGVSHLKLHKLMYYVDSWALAFLEEPLVNEQFEAWLHGPVVRTVFRRFRDCGVYEILPPPGNPEQVIASFEQQIAPEQKEIIDDVLQEYGAKSGYHLECLTHQELPWKEARHGVEPGAPSENVISKATMKSFYQSMIE